MELPPPPQVPTTTLPCWRKPCPVSPEKITLSMPRSQSPDFLVMVRLMEVTMLTQKPNAKFSTSVLLMVLVVLLNTASSVLMEPFSTRTTSSVTGGSTLIAPRLRDFTASMTNLLLSVKPLQPQVHREVMPLPIQMQLQLEVMTPQLESSKMPRLLMVKPPETAEDKEDQEEGVNFNLTLCVTSATDGFVVPSKT